MECGVDHEITTIYMTLLTPYSAEWTLPAQYEPPYQIASTILHYNSTELTYTGLKQSGFYTGLTILALK